MKLFTLISICLALNVSTFGQTCYQNYAVTIGVTTNAQVGDFEGLYYKADTNDAPHWYAICEFPATTIYFSATNGPLPNPCLLLANTQRGSKVSAYCTPFLFDTNNYPVPAGTTNQVFTLPLDAPVILNVSAVTN